MYMRIVRATPNPGQANELARRWEDSFLPRMKAIPGFQKSYFGSDPADSRTAVVTLWDTQPDTSQLPAMVEAFRNQVADIISGPPEIIDYEVITEG